MLRLHRWGLLAILALVLSACHASSPQTPLPQGSWWIDMEKFLASPHGHFQCSECHANIEEKGVKHPNPDLLGKVAAALYDYKRCEKCHPQEYQRYLKGVHAKALQEKKKDAPTCGHCHVTHYVPTRLSRVELGKWQTDMCGTCHAAATHSYLENYHGKAAATLNHEASAYCSDCHGAHTCLSLKKKEESLEVCKKCHLKADLKFTGFVIHATKEDVKKEDVEKLGKVTLIRWLEIIFGLFVLCVLAFFYSHTLLWTVRKVHEWLKRK